MKIVIPARRNSKGLPFKNRQLFRHTVDKIPNKWNAEIQSTNLLDDHWWKMFNDTLLNNYYEQFINKNPDFNSISNQLNISYQLSNIEGSIIYPGLLASSNANYSEGNFHVQQSKHFFLIL